MSTEERIRQVAVGFGRDVPVVVKSGEQIVVESNKPPCLFRPKRLIIPSDIAGAFSVKEIWVNEEPTLMLIDKCLPARMFSEFATDSPHWNLPTTRAAIKLVVKNETGAPQTFVGAFTGDAHGEHPGQKP